MPISPILYTSNSLVQIEGTPVLTRITTMSQFQNQIEQRQVCAKRSRVAENRFFTELSGLNIVSLKEECAYLIELRCSSWIDIGYA